jgi:5-methylcytosine-specific restriction endonuclease McrA
VTDGALGSGLPHPESPEVSELLKGAYALLYKFLYERRSTPPTMVEIRSYMEQQLGEAPAQTDRRVRELRCYFDIPAERQGKHAVYRLGVRKTDDPSPAKRSKISRRTEAEVFERDGYFCAMCGQGPKDGLKLVIDHRIPVKWGGTNDASNLQVLCVDHNHGKQAHFSSFDKYGAAIKQAIGLADVHRRIGELLIVLKGQDVPVELITTVARDENRGDPIKRMRELRQLGWIITNKVRRVRGKRSHSTYTLISFSPWPEGGVSAAVRRIESARKRRRDVADESDS